MSGRLPTWFALSLLAVLAAVTFWLDRKVGDSAATAAALASGEPDYTIEGFSATVFGKEGKPRYRLTARGMSHYPAEDATQLQDPVFQYVDPGQVPLRATARHATVEGNGDVVHLRDDVKLVRQGPRGQSPVTIETSYLRIVPDDERATTDQPVVFTGPGTRVTAVGLELDNRSRIVTLSSQVKARFENKGR